MSFAQKILVASNRHKTCEKDVVIVTFDLIGLLPTNHIIIKLQGQTGVYEETFDVNIKIAQTPQNSWDFKYCWKVESTEHVLNGRLRRLSGRFHTLIWRPGDTVQNLESPGLSRRVDSTVACKLKRISDVHFSPPENECLRTVATKRLLWHKTFCFDVG